MKKLVAISLCSLVLVAGSVAYATGGSLIGKKVDKTISVVVNGQKAKTEAVIIDGVTYAPVRAVGEMTGSAVKYEGGVVKVDSVLIPVVKDNDQIDKQILKLKEEIGFYNREVKTVTESLEKYKQYYEKEKIQETTGVKFEDSADYLRGQGIIEQSNKEIEKRNAQIADLDSQKTK